MDRGHTPRFAAGSEEDSIYYNARPPKHNDGIIKTIAIVLMIVILMSIFTPPIKPLELKLQKADENIETIEYNINIENPSLKTYLQHTTYLYFKDTKGLILETHQVGRGFMLWPYQKLEYTITVKRPNTPGTFTAEITAKR